MLKTYKKNYLVADKKKKELEKLKKLLAEAKKSNNKDESNRIYREIVDCEKYLLKAVSTISAISSAECL